MAKICTECGKRAYRTESSAITVALRCSRSRGAALRIYRCPHHPAWHLTKRPTWTAESCSEPVESSRLCYRSEMAALLVQHSSVDESALISIAATIGDEQNSVSAARAAIDAWCHWGLVYPDGPTVTAIDVEALLAIARYGWNRWLASRSLHLVTYGASHDL